MLHMERVNSQMYHILQMFIIFYASCYLQYCKIRPSRNAILYH